MYNAVRYVELAKCWLDNLRRSKLEQFNFSAKEDLLLQERNIKGPDCKYEMLETREGLEVD